MQILQLLKSPKDAWTRIVRKVANDTVQRIFNHFKNEEISSEKRLTKELFLQCFQNGKSTTRKIKGLTNWGDTHVGREILVINNKKEIEKVFTFAKFYMKKEIEKSFQFLFLIFFLSQGFHGAPSDRKC